MEAESVPRSGVTSVHCVCVLTEPGSGGCSYPAPRVCQPCWGMWGHLAQRLKCEEVLQKLSQWRGFPHPVPLSWLLLCSPWWTVYESWPQWLVTGVDFCFLCIQMPATLVKVKATPTIKDKKQNHVFFNLGWRCRGTTALRGGWGFSFRHGVYPQAGWPPCSTHLPVRQPAVLQIGRWPQDKKQSIYRCALPQPDLSPSWGFSCCHV